MGYLYLPHIKVQGLVINTLYIFLIWSIFQIIAKKKIYFSKFLIYILPIQIIFLAFSNVLNGYIEFSLLKEILIFPFYYSAGAVIIYNQLKSKGMSYVIRMISYAVVTNSVLILVLVIFQDLNPLFHEFIYITPKQNKYIYTLPLNVRHSGLAVSGFSYLSFKTCCLYFTLIFYQLHENYFSKIYFNVISLIILCSLLFIARTGLFLGLFGYLFYLFSKSKGIFYLLIILIIASSSFIFGTLVSLNEGNFSYAFNRSFDLFLNNQKNGTILDLESEVNSFELNNIIFGDGNYGRDKGLISDIGFISFLKGGGLLGLFLLTLHWFLFILKSMNSRTNWIFRAIFYLSILHLLFNGKELVFYSHGYIQALVILLILYGFQKNNYRYGSILSK